MTIVNHSYPKFRADDGNGVPIAGAQLFTYSAGTSTKKTTYVSQTGAENTNPIILDANGECDLWYEGSAKLVLAPSTDTDPPVSSYWTQDNIGSREAVTTSDTILYNFIKNSSFELAGDTATEADGWTFTPGTDNTLIRDITEAIHGTSSLKFTIGGSNTAQADSSIGSVLAGQKYIIRHALKSNSATADIDININWKDKDSVLVSTVSVYADAATNPTTWTIFEKELTAPATATQADITITVSVNTSIVYIDYLSTFPVPNDLVVDGQLAAGSVTDQGDGTIHAENGLYCNNSRNTKTVYLDTPELITSSPTIGAWTTVDNSTLSTAKAISAIFKLYSAVTSPNGAPTEYRRTRWYLRKTGSGLATDALTVQTDAYVYCPVAGITQYGRDHNTSVVNLDANYDFDYHVANTQLGATGSQTAVLVLVGYVVEC